MGNKLIQPQEAVKQIVLHASSLPGEKIELQNAIGRILMEDVMSPIDMPPFDQSAMDGYAVCGLNHDEFLVIGEHKAGDKPQFELKEKQAIRIFTGAIVPETAISVVKQEDIKLSENKIQTTNGAIVKNDNIRRKGEQVKKGELAVVKGTPLQAGSIGFLATLGITHVKVAALPKVSIVTTGNELVPPGASLIPGQIYESNSIMLQAALQRENIFAERICIDDNKKQTELALKKAIEESNIVLITGGISVGDYDFVYEVLKNLEVKELFYKVSQKPGKPLFVGKCDQTFVFGLPGNPAAALTCFYWYVTPALRAMQSHLVPELLRTKAKLTSSYLKKGSLNNHLKGKLIGDTVEILPKQSSAMLGDFTDANCIVILPQEERMYKENDIVEVMLLPY